MSDQTQEIEKAKEKAPKGNPIEVASEVISNPKHSEYSADRAASLVLAGGEGGLIAAMDGVGSGGEFSAQVAEIVRNNLVEMENMFLKPPSMEEAEESLKKAIFSATKEIQRLQNEIGSRQIDTTVSAAIITEYLGDEGRYLVTANVGDSRIYRFNPATGETEQLTKDHTMAQQLVERGDISVTEAFTHPASYHLTKSVGALKDKEDIDIKTIHINEGDIFLAVSDGVTDNFPPRLFPIELKKEYNKALSGNRKVIDPKKMAQGLAQRALKVMNEGSASWSKKDDICVSVMTA